MNPKASTSKSFLAYNVILQEEKHFTSSHQMQSMPRTHCSWHIRKQEECIGGVASANQNTVRGRVGWTRKHRRISAYTHRAALPCVIPQTFWRSFTLLSFHGQMPKHTNEWHTRTNDTTADMKHETVATESVPTSGMDFYSRRPDRMERE